MAELNDSAGGYDWAWQKDAKALKEKLEAAGAAEATAEDGDAKAALKLSMDNILMVGGNTSKSGTVASFSVAARGGQDIIRAVAIVWANAVKRVFVYARGLGVRSSALGEERAVHTRVPDYMFAF